MNQFFNHSDWSLRKAEELASFNHKVTRNLVQGKTFLLCIGKMTAKSAFFLMIFTFRITVLLINYRCIFLNVFLWMNLFYTERLFRAFKRDSAVLARFHCKNKLTSRIGCFVRCSLFQYCKLFMPEWGSRDVNFKYYFRYCIDWIHVMK